MTGSSPASDPLSSPRPPRLGGESDFDFEGDGEGDGDWGRDGVRP